MVVAALLGAAALAIAAPAPAADTGWSTVGGGAANTRFSPLSQLTPATAPRLKLAYAFPLGTPAVHESVPLVVDGLLYVTSSNGPQFTYALNAATGKLVWRYAPELPTNTRQFSCCDTPNRGVAYAAGKVFVGRLDGYLVALDARTGKELWKSKAVDYTEGAVITSEPLVAGPLVITGHAGGEYGVKGALAAFDLETGKLAWRTYTVPVSADDPAAATWKGDSWKVGGSAPWLGGSYDAANDTVYWGTSNPSPQNATLRSTGTTDYGQLTNLYSSATLALDAKTGKIKWWLQTTPADAWDFDGVNELVLADLPVGGRRTPVLMKADRNGFFYVADRTNGKLISAEPFVEVNWAKGIDLKTARPIEVEGKRAGAGAVGKDVCPSAAGGKNWPPMSFSPQTGLVYIPAFNTCQTFADVDVTYRRGLPYRGRANSGMKRGTAPWLGEMLAWDPVKQRAAWRAPEPLPFVGGALATAGGLLFYGTADGWFKAADARTGKAVWRISLGASIAAAPMTFSIGGKQYVAVVAGRNLAPPLAPVVPDPLSVLPDGGTLFVFAL
jgi:PQQ-dependent dehydrogenase (methanol/ethanol family)